MAPAVLDDEELDLREGDIDHRDLLFEPEAQVAWLTIRRNDEEDVKERELYVSLDGRRIAVLIFGDVATMEIAPGRHTLRVHNTLSRKAVDFTVAPRQHVRFRSANVRGRGYNYWAFFVGAALLWTVLEREADGPPVRERVPPVFRV